MNYIELHHSGNETIVVDLSTDSELFRGTREACEAFLRELFGAF